MYLIWFHKFRVQTQEGKWKLIYGQKSDKSKKFIVRRQYIQDVMSCKSLELNGKRVKIEMPQKLYKTPAYFFIHETGYYHSPYNNRISNSILSKNSDITLQNHIMKEIPNFANKCKVDAEYDKCLNNILSEKMNDSAGCVLANHWYAINKLFQILLPATFCLF